MSAPTHLLVNTLIGVSLYKVGLIDSLGLAIAFIAAGWLIDIDHILYTTIKHKTFSPKKIIQIERTAGKNMQARLYIFHSREFNLALIVASIFYPVLFIFVGSNIIHIALDIIAHYKHHKSFKFTKEWSILYYLVK